LLESRIGVLEPLSGIGPLLDKRPDQLSSEELCSLLGNKNSLG
jgi:hypothetical protein